MERIIQAGITPHVDQIARIGIGGSIVVVVFEPSETAKMALTHWNWTGAPCFRMTTRHRKTMAKALEAMGDEAAARWLMRKQNRSDPVIRIFLFVHDATFCINFTPEKGYWVEPKTLDHERVASLH